MLVKERGIGIDEFLEDLRFEGNGKSDFRKAYSELSEKLDRREGEKVLIVRRRLGNKQMFGWPVDSEKWLGVFNGMYLGECRNVVNGIVRYDRCKCVVIETEKCVHSKERSELRSYQIGEEIGWKLKEGPIELSWLSFAGCSGFVPSFFGQASYQGTDLLRSRKHIASLDFFVGDQEIEDFFRIGESWYYSDVSREYRRDGNRGIIEYRTNLDDIFDFSYVPALELLDLEVPEEFKRLFDERIETKKTNIVKSLDNLVIELENIEKQLKQWGYISGRKSEGIADYITGSEVYGLAPECATAAILDFGEQKREKIDTIKRMLKSAVLLRMYENNGLINLGQPGKNICVEDFISGLCERFEIKIPKN